MATGDTGTRPTADAPVDEHAELRAVIAKAKAGDASVLPQLRAILDGNPALVKRYGDLGRQAEAAWVALAAGTNLYMRETFARTADARRAELTRPGASPVEKLLVERVVACDLQLGYLTTAEADALGAGDGYRQLDFHAKRVERAQRMFLTATAALVAFQRLVPAARLVAEPVVAIHSQPAKTEQTAEPHTTADAAGRVTVAIESAEPDEARSEPHDRLRVGVTC